MYIKKKYSKKNKYTDKIKTIDKINNTLHAPVLTLSIYRTLNDLSIKILNTYYNIYFFNYLVIFLLSLEQTKQRRCHNIYSYKCSATIIGVHIKCFQFEINFHYENRFFIFFYQSCVEGHFILF